MINENFYRPQRWDSLTLAQAAAIAAEAAEEAPSILISLPLTSEQTSTSPHRAPEGPALLLGKSNGKAVNTEGVDLWESHCLISTLGPLIWSENLFSTSERHPDLLTDLYYFY